MESIETDKKYKAFFCKNCWTEISCSDNCMYEDDNVTFQKEDFYLVQLVFNIAIEDEAIQSELASKDEDESVSQTLLLRKFD